MGSAGRIISDRPKDRRWARTVAQELESPVATVAKRVAFEFGLSATDINTVIGSGALSAADTGPGGESGDKDWASLADLSDPDGGWRDPWLVGEVHEYAVSGGERRRRGAWYTPRGVARELVGLTVDAGGVMFIADPCCGGGGFLLAAVERLAQASYSPLEALASIGGHDIDLGAVEATRWALSLWAIGHGAPVAQARRLVDQQITQADSLHDHDSTWPGRRLIVGNPPFASPLKSGAMSTAASSYRNQHAEDLGPYADQSFFHLHQAVTSCEPGSVVTLVQPQSLLAGRDGRPLRALLAHRASLRSMWVTRRAVFDAGTRVCAPVLQVGGARRDVVRLVADGRDVNAHSPVGPGETTEVGPSTWSALAARALGAPDLPSQVWNPSDTLSSLATATAGFRDEYYGLARAAYEGEASPTKAKRLLTVGAVEPLVSTWGHQSIRLAGERRLRPVVDLDDLDPKVRRWTEEQLRPKVVLATQTRVLEPVIDPVGDLIPLTPLISVFCDPEDLYLVAAVLLSPPVVAWAWQQRFGTAMSVDAVKLAARDVLRLPLPSDQQAWREAASVLAATQPDRDDGDVVAGWRIAGKVGHLMTKAYGVDPEVTQWWRARAKKSWTLAAPQNQSEPSGSPYD